MFCFTFQKNPVCAHTGLLFPEASTSQQDRRFNRWDTCARSTKASRKLIQLLCFMVLLFIFNALQLPATSWKPTPFQSGLSWSHNVDLIMVTLNQFYTWRSSGCSLRAPWPVQILTILQRDFLWASLIHRDANCRWLWIFSSLFTSLNNR